MTSPSVPFDEAFLRQLEHLAIVSRRPAAGHLRGSHRSRRTGTGMIFTDYRPYSAGDDTRNLDWGTYLRLDRLVLRLFEEEADLPIYIFLDTSRSMDFGAPTKFDFARRLAAALAYVGLINHDRVSVTAFSDCVVQEMPARRGRNQIWRMLHFLERLRPQGRTSLQATFQGYFSARRTRGMVMVVSDFLDRSGFESAFQVIRQLRHEVFALHVVGPQESDPQLGEEVVLVDAEDGGAAQVRIGAELREAYRQAFARYSTEIEVFCRGHGWGYLRASTTAPFEQLMLRALREEGLIR
ncbi:MAG TPA: DUF58 domain-containing protein [Burkholderiales bacterium]|nr:DUF58 domain-containing protein [Burkholderiales bacterium]